MKERDNSTQDSVKKEMAKPRMVKSARVPERPSISVSGTVQKIIPSWRSGLPEKAHIVVEGDDNSRRALRVDNTLTDEHGDDVKLKKGTHVEVTVTKDR